MKLSYCNPKIGPKVTLVKLVDYPMYLKTWSKFIKEADQFKHANKTSSLTRFKKSIRKI
jgi:hypothetical protein